MPKLGDYNKKRNFDHSPEPAGNLEKSGLRRFCVQKHDAQRLHYDFRIESDGVLLSWAVPKGPSADPAVKRLAIQTEDHPVSYLTFEGTIPDGNYGAGSVILWDLGTYGPPPDKQEHDVETMIQRQYQDGKIHIFLEGRKLKGEYTLVRTGREKNHWLLIKVKDRYAGRNDFPEHSILSGRLVTEVEEDNNALARAVQKGRPAPFPDYFTPMLATQASGAFSDQNWIFEVKYDGYRCLIFKKLDTVEILSRNGQSLNAKFPELVDAAENLPSGCVMDGEIIVPDKSGGGDFAKLQKYFRDGQKYPLRLILFDLLYLAGRDLTAVPLDVRKGALQLVLDSMEDKRIVYSHHIKRRGEDYWKASQKLGLEGVMGKRKNSLYHKNSRSRDWVKIKNVNMDDFVVVGLTPSPSARAFGAILLARPVGPDEFEFAGKVGTGFTEKDMRQILNILKKKKVKEGVVEAGEEVLFYTEPYYYVQVKFKEVTEGGKLRHPSFVGLREDKFYRSEDQKHSVVSQSPSVEKDTIEVPRGVKLTNTDKMFFPEENVTKGDVIAYYNQMVEWILPHLMHRPLTLKRNPNGIKDNGFYQKDVKDDLPAYVHTVQISSKSSEKDFLTYAVCNNHKSLIFLVNYGCVEMHCWNSREDKLDRPDHLVFDIDPPGNDFGMAKDGALHLIGILDQLEVAYGIKTSGGDGIHLYVPIQRKYSHTQAKDMTHLIARRWLKKMGKKGSLERTPSRRKNQVYMDYLQNGRGKTMACPYSLRVRSGVPVSMPVSLSELESLTSPAEFNISSVLTMMGDRKDPWNGLYDQRMKLEEIVEKLESIS